jgi:hypothetical protein
VADHPVGGRNGEEKGSNDQHGGSIRLHKGKTTSDS